MTPPPTSLAPPPVNLLTPEHSLPIEIGAGFRSPDEAWVYGAPESFEGIDGVALLSNFWFGPLEVATSFASHLANELNTYLPDLQADLDEEGVDVDPPLEVAVCLWRSMDGLHGLVASLSLSNEFRFWNAGPPLDLVSLNRFDKVMHTVAGDGMDNDPVLLIYGDDGETEAAGGLPHDLRRPFANMLIEASKPDLHDELKVELDKQFPSWKGDVVAPPRRTFSAR